MLEKIDGIIIKTQDYGETNKIVTIFSKKLGKFSAIARGAKKPKSRMAAVTQPFIYGEFFVYVNSGLSTMQQGEVLHSFRAIREDIIKTAYTAYITELTDKLMEFQNPDIYIYGELIQSMDWISEQEDADIPIMMYELKLFEKGGFAPTVDRCVNCGNNEGLTAFSIAEGGLLCSRCRNFDQQAISLPASVAKLFYVLANAQLERVGSISIKPENKQLLRHILDAYYDQYGGYFLKSRKFLNQLDSLR
ncbi:DNA repair protein RecO (recombination protein O) [Virgibacillus natechei]|uniref:DNA repair protein RecO n=1 Tax=Virgibacillus natechei TaxID=1216297 RepID=A0ABS4ICM5_9BACI|nr:DNA repair protein RecO [Virgibacillus natechei]MBP1968697.1 DNA repair protein RecO (recombination protein O) [Virgibacillus natechei]UZD11499.1 DNA repair protein RecO [Virgibacillus natechei]